MTNARQVTKAPQGRQSRPKANHSDQGCRRRGQCVSVDELTQLWLSWRGHDGKKNGRFRSRLHPGAAQMDGAIRVVSAADGLSWRPQWLGP